MTMVANDTIVTSITTTVAKEIFREHTITVVGQDLIEALITTMVAKDNILGTHHNHGC